MAFTSLAVLFTAVLLTRGLTLVRWPAISLWAAGFGLIPWVQWMLGVSLFAGDALMVSYYQTGWAIAMMIGYHIAKQSGAQSELALMHMLWIAALLSAMVGLLQWLKLDEYWGIYAVQTDVGDPVMGNLAQPNQLGTLLLMGIVAFAYVYERRVIGLSTLAMGTSFLTTILVLTHSRAGMVGVLAVGAFLLAKRPSMNFRISAWQIVAWMGLFVLMSLASPYVDQALLLSVDREPLFTVNGRTLIWLQALEGIRSAPWTGYGWNQSFSAISVGAIDHPGVLIATYAHNILLDILAWNGVPMGLALIGLGGFWFCSRLYRVSGIAGTYAMACLLPFTLHSMVELSFAYAYFLLAAGLLMGVVEASLTGTGAWKLRRYLVGSALAIWVIVGICIAYEYMLIEEDVRVTRFQNLRVGATDAAYQIPEIRLLSHMAALQRATRLQPVSHMTAQQLDDLRRAVVRFPGGGLALRYAMALGMNGDPAGALRMLTVIRGVYGTAFFAEAKQIWFEQAEKNAELGAIELPQ